MSKEHTRLLDELTNIGFGRSKPTESTILTKGDHVIHSAINLLDEIEEVYGADAAKRLELRLLQSIKQRDPKKFRITKK